MFIHFLQHDLKEHFKFVQPLPETFHQRQEKENLIKHLCLFVCLYVCVCVCLKDRQTERGSCGVLTVIYRVIGVKRMCTLNHLLRCWHGNLPILRMNDAGPACSIECLVICLNMNEGVCMCVC